MPRPRSPQQHRRPREPFSAIQCAASKQRVSGSTSDCTPQLGDATLHAASKLTCADIPLKSAAYHHLSSRTPARKHDETYGPKQRQLLNTNIGRGSLLLGVLQFPWIGVCLTGLGWSASLPTHALVMTPRTTYPPHGPHPSAITHHHHVHAYVRSHGPPRLWVWRCCAGASCTLYSSMTFSNLLSQHRSAPLSHRGSTTVATRGARRSGFGGRTQTRCRVQIYP